MTRGDAAWRRPLVLVPSTVLALVIAAAVALASKPWAPLAGVLASLTTAILLLRPHWLVSALVYAAALYAYRVTVPLGFNMSLYRLLFLLLAGRLVWDVAIVSMYDSHRVMTFWRRGRMLFALLSVVAIAYAIAMVRGPGGMAGLLGEKRFFNVLIGLLSILMIAFYVRERRHFRLAAIAYVVGAFLVVFIGFYQYTTWLLTGTFPPLPLQSLVWLEELSVKADVITAIGFPRLESVFHDPNVLGSYLVLAILVACGLYYDSDAAPRVTRTMLLVSALASGLALGATLSRSAFGMLALSLAVFAWPWRRDVVAGLRRRAGPLLAGATMVVVTSVWILSANASVFELVATIWDARLQLAWDPTRAERFALGLQLFADSPLLGAGLGTIYQHIPVDLTSTAHNFYLTLLAEAGLIGFVAAMALVSYLVAQAVAELRADRGPGGATPRALASGLIGLLAVQLIYDSLFSPEVFWVFFGLLAVRRIWLHAA